MAPWLAKKIPALACTYACMCTCMISISSFCNAYMTSFFFAQACMHALAAAESKPQSCTQTKKIWFTLCCVIWTTRFFKQALRFSLLSSYETRHPIHQISCIFVRQFSWPCLFKFSVLALFSRQNVHEYFSNQVWQVNDYCMGEI